MQAEFLGVSNPECCCYILQNELSSHSQDKVDNDSGKQEETQHGRSESVIIRTASSVTDG